MSVRMKIRLVVILMMKYYGLLGLARLALWPLAALEMSSAVFCMIARRVFLNGNFLTDNYCMRKSVCLKETGHIYMMISPKDLGIIH